MKLNRRKIVFLSACALALLVVPVLTLGLTGKYRLLLKPRNTAASSGIPSKQETPSAPAGAASVSAAEVLERILRTSTVDFYRPGNPADARRPTFDIPDSVSLIAGVEKDRSYISRIRAVERLGGNLSGREIFALLYFLHKKPGDEDLPLLEFDAIKNNVAAALMRQAEFSDKFAPHLIAMYYDRSLDEVWRNYCVQFLGQCYGRIEIQQVREVVRNLFRDALKDEGGIPGAALIAMAGLAENPEFDRDEIAGTAYALCMDGKTDVITRAAALQICAKFKKREILPLARDIAMKPEDVFLRMSAIAVIGAMGDGADRDTLSGLAESADVRLRTASNAALRKISSVE